MKVVLKGCECDFFSREIISADLKNIFQICYNIYSSKLWRINQNLIKKIKSIKKTRLHSAIALKLIEFQSEGHMEKQYGYIIPQYSILHKTMWQFSIKSKKNINTPLNNNNWKWSLCIWNLYVKNKYPDL